MAPLPQPVPPVRLSPLAYLLCVFCLLNLGAACLLLAAHQHPAWWLGVALFVTLIFGAVQAYGATWRAHNGGDEM